MILVTNYGLYYHETKSKPKKFVIAFTSHVRVRNLFLQLMNSEMPKEDFLRRTYRGKDQKRTEIIVSEEKQFGMVCFTILKRKLFQLVFTMVSGMNMAFHNTYSYDTNKLTWGNVVLFVGQHSLIAL